VAVFLHDHGLALTLRQRLFFDGVEELPAALELGPYVLPIVSVDPFADGRYGLSKSKDRVFRSTVVRERAAQLEGSIGAVRESA
jgi:hypothetical protein